MMATAKKTAEAPAVETDETTAVAKKTAPVLPANKQSRRKSDAELKREAQADADKKRSELEAERKARRAEGPRTYSKSVDKIEENILFIDGDTDEPHYGRKLSLRATEALWNTHAEIEKLEDATDEKSQKRYYALVDQFGSQVLTPEAYRVWVDFEISDQMEIAYDAMFFASERAQNELGKSSGA